MFFRKKTKIPLRFLKTVNTHKSNWYCPHTYTKERSFMLLTISMLSTSCPADKGSFVPAPGIWPCNQTQHKVSNPQTHPSIKYITTKQNNALVKKNWFTSNEMNYATKITTFHIYILYAFLCIWTMHCSRQESLLPSYNFTERRRRQKKTPAPISRHNALLIYCSRQKEKCLLR